MSFSGYLKDKLFFLILQSLLIAFIGGLLHFYKVDTGILLVICSSMFLICVVSFLWEYGKKHQFYREMRKNLHTLNKKHYISTMLDTPAFEEGRILCEILNETSKSMNDEIAVFRHQTEEYRDYIEAWVHEIKLPIACIDLMCENNKSALSSSLKNELIRIDNFVEQALYYARCSTVEKDYLIKSISLVELVRTTIKKHSKQLIGAKAKIEMNLSNITVCCDPKWLDFILGQLISNSIKYKKDPFILKFLEEESKDYIALSLIDNGIGIPEKDLERVCEKGFTGTNGRQTQKSTGIGLYLCKNLCDKLYLGFEITSKIQEFTCVKIIFPKDSRSMLE